MKVVGLDLGFGWTKATDGQKVFRMPSVIGEPRQRFESLTNGHHDVSVMVNGREWFIGGLAIRQSDLRYFSLKERKADSPVTEVLMLAALGSIADGEEELAVVSGLPLDFYFAQREGLSAQLKSVAGRPISFKEGPTKRVTVREAKIVPQPLGSLLATVLAPDGEIADRPLAAKTILVADVGFYTLDLLLVRALEVIQPFSKSVPLGLSVAYKLIQEALRRDFGKSVQLFEVDEIAMSGIYRSLDVKPLVAEAYKALARQVALEIDGLNADYDLLLVSGGGGGQLYDYLSAGRKAILARDAQMANVTGFLYLGNRTWQRKNLGS